MAKRSKGKPKRVVLADVARQANVSATTVSAVLHACKGNNTRFSEATARIVREAAEKLGYRANRTFRNLNRQRQGTLGVVHAPGAYLSPYTISAMSHEAGQSDFMLSLSHVDGQEPIFIKEDAVDGVIVFGQINQTLLERIAELEIPVMHVNNNRRNRPGTMTFDEAGGMAAAVDHLAENGCGSLCLIERGQGRGQEHYSRSLRWKALEQSCKKHTLRGPIRHVLKHPWGGDLRREIVSPEPLIEEMQTLLAPSDGLDAVILDYRILSAPLYEAARRAGRRVPQDLCVVGVNTFDPIDHTYPFLSSITLDFEELGRQIIRTLVEMVDNPQAPGPAITFPMKFVRRCSS
jgi:LacI family transcriptional regulator